MEALSGEHIVCHFVEARLFVCVLLVAFTTFTAIAIGICHNIPSDPVLHRRYAEEVSEISYLLPCLAFGTALLLNTLTLAVERKSVKMRMILIVCYINAVAALTDFMGWMDMTPVLRDPWGQGVMVTRLVMWLWTTPAMVYLLGLISDMSLNEVLMIVASDAGMLILLLYALVQSSQIVAVIFIGCSISLYIYTMIGVWQMFQAPIESAGRDTASTSLRVVRGFTVVMWTSFIVVFMSSKLRLVSVSTEEWLWGIVDFLGKVMFSSSLLQSNFITMEERRLNAMKLVEEGRREQVIQELTSLVQQKEQFMSSMSNELRTPLNGIIGLSDALLIGCCGELSQVSYSTVQTIKNSGLRLLSLVNDILDAATVQHGKLTIRHERVKLDRLIDDIMDLLKPQAKKNVRLVNDIGPTMPPVLGDSGRLMQIFHNLIGNCCRYTYSGSIVVSAMLKMDEVEVAVADSGVGIPRDKLEKICKTQTQEGDPQGYTGTGLGLTLVKQLVEAHGGTMMIKSKLGVGTTFYLSFKVWDPTVHAEDVTKVMTPSDIELTRQRVMRMLSILHLRGAGGASRVTPTASGAGAPNIPQLDPSQLRSAASAHPILTTDMGQPRGIPGQPESATAMLPATPTKPDNMTANKKQIVSTNLLGVLGAGPARPDNTAGVVSSTQRWQTGAAQHAGAAAAAAAAAARDSEVAAADGVVQCKRHVGWAVDSEPQAGVGGAAEGVDVRRTEEEGAVHGVQLRRRSLSGRQMHVLSIDDDNVNQMLVEGWLVPEGFKVTRAMDGQEALELLQDMNELPDVILLDVMMPGMNGYEVCRKLRELYPDACVPIIMVSAKSKEDDVVQGLTVGANDFISKPYSSKEILARIYAHLRYRKQVMKAASEGTESHKSMMSDNLTEVLCVESKAFSLPASIKSKVENSTGVSTPLQVFDDLTMVVIGITNLEALAASRTTSMVELLGWLSSLFIYLEDLLIQYNAYLVDCMEDKLVIVTGLANDTLTDQACNAVELTNEVIRLAGTLTPSSSPSRLLLSAGIHTCTATAAIVGVQHPVLQVTGALAEKATQLQSTCPPGCIHVSKRVLELYGRPNDFALATTSWGQARSDATYLQRIGPWEAHIQSMSVRFDRYMAAHPFGPVNSRSLRCRPVQRALLCLLQADVGRLVELLCASQPAELLGKQTRSMDSEPRAHVSAALPAPSDAADVHVVEEGGPASDTVGAPDVTGADVVVGPADPDSNTTIQNLQLVTKLQLDKEALQRLLEQKTTETDRLQVVVDNLQLDLYGLDALQAQLTSSTHEVGRLRSQVAMLQHQRRLVATLPNTDRVPEAPASFAAAPSNLQQHILLMAQQRDLGPQSVPGFYSAALVPGMHDVPSAFYHALGDEDHDPPGRPATRTYDVRVGNATAALAAHDMGSRIERLRTVGSQSLITIGEFLTSAGLAHLAPVFMREEITPDMLPHIADATLMQLGITSVGDLARLRRAAQSLQ